MIREKWALVTLSADGVTTASRLAKYLDDREVVVFTKEKYIKSDEQVIDSDISSFFGKIMKDYSIICAIMASGIVVRAIAPFLKHKSEDPGILVMDTRGDFVISLLSGHLGGANDAARLVEDRLGAKAIITTGTDVKGTMAVDVLAAKITCAINDFKAAKEITARILHGEKIGLLNPEAWPIDKIELPSNIQIMSSECDLSACQGLIIISRQKDLSAIKHDRPFVQLIPKTLVLGIGCRKNVAGAKIIGKIKMVMADLGRHEKSIKALATIELKKDEAGITEACDYFKARKIIIPDAMVKMVESQFEGSDFVHRTTGLYAVSEPCGYIGSAFGSCLLEKKKLDGITLSVWQEK